MSAPHPFAGKRVGVVLGGRSAEREVSLNSGAGVIAALRERGWDAVAIDWTATTALPTQLADAGVQVVWNALHGTFGEDGAVQGLCACLGIACTGSGILGSALAMDKIMSKRIFETSGVPTPSWRILPGAGPGPDRGPLDGSDAATALADFALPFVIKPASEGSSVGVTIVTDRDQAPAALALARKHHGDVIVEEYIAGTELGVGILNGEVLGSVEIQPALEWYTYEVKYLRNDTRYLVPPAIDAGIVAEAERAALDAYRVLGCGGHARADLRIRTDGAPFVLEMNTLPGMTATSLLPKIARHKGIDYATLCEQILASAT